MDINLIKGRRSCFLCNRVQVLYDKSIGFHEFPQEPHQRSLWYKFCGLSEEVDRVSNSTVICSLHFNENDYDPQCKYESGEGSMILKLKPDAVPSHWHPRTQKGVTETTSGSLPEKIEDQSKTTESFLNTNTSYVKMEEGEDVEMEIMPNVSYDFSFMSSEKDDMSLIESHPCTSTSDPLQICTYAKKKNTSADIDGTFEENMPVKLGESAETYTIQSQTTSSTVSRMESKRARGRNFTETEKNILYELVTTKYKHIIENKDTDGVTIAKKKLAWQEIAQTFNRHNQTGHRTSKQLHALFDNIKRSRGNLLTDKRNAYKTVSGTCSPPSSALDDQIVNSVKLHKPIQNQNVSSVTYLDAKPDCSKDSGVIESFNIVDMPIICSDGPGNEVANAAMVELGSNVGNGSRTPELTPMFAAVSPEVVPTASTGEKRKAVPEALVVFRKKSAMEILSNRFMRRKNFKDRHDEQLHVKRLEILNIEKQTKLKQLALVEQQLEQQRKLFQLNYEARVEEIAFEKKVREMKRQNLES